MRFRTLLNHRCSLLTQGKVIGQDEYGRDIIEQVEIMNVPCRLDQIRQKVVAGEVGTDFVYEQVMFFDNDAEVTLVEEISHITDLEGVLIVEGSFSIDNINPVFGRKKLHHFELSVKRK